MRHLLLAFIFCLTFSGSNADNLEDNNGLPTIWSAINAGKHYHIMFQIQMLNSSERLTVEEWASFDTNKHRLDLISDSGRTTYLTNTKTGEIFMYRPYSCTLLDDDANELQTIATLFRGYPIDTSTETGEMKPTLAYGLGPLWLNAKAQADSVVQLMRESVRNYDVYSVELKKGNKDFDYTLRFVFRKGFKFVDSIEWISGAIRSDRVLVQVRSKIIQMPGDEPIAEEIFDIPVGYGCVRSHKFDHPFQVNPGLKFLHEGAPNKAILEVSLGYPKDSTHHSWQTNRYSLSLMRGTMRLNNVTRSYYVSLVQFRELSSGKLRRQKKVWSDWSDSQASAILYSINPDSGECRASHVSSAERLRLEFPSQSREMSSPPPVQISLDLLDWLFNNWDKFHLIAEKPSVLSLILREATYELRMDELRLDEKSAPIWSGPVSIVKEVSLMAQFVTYPFDINDIKLFDSYHTKVTIFFYSDDLAKVQYKITFNLFENTVIDVNHMQRQLDISNCLSEQRTEQIVVKYPIEEEETRTSLVAMQDILLELFCMNLFSSTPIDPLSVNKFEISFDQFNMFIKFNLLDIPLWQTFQMKAGLSLDWGAALFEKSSGSLESCAEACEHHNCVRFAFNQASKRCQLEVGLEQSLAVRRISKEFALFEAPKFKMHSSWIDLDANEGRKHLRPHELLEILRKFVLLPEGVDRTGVGNRTNDDGVNIPLTIEIERPLVTEHLVHPEFISLRPISIHSSLDEMNEIIRIAPKATGSNQTSELIFVTNRSKLRAEYSILLEDRDYAEGKRVGQEFGVLSYDECAANCDNSNCRSFSYCASSNKCVVSRMHNNTELKKQTKHSFTCTISVLDYLTKFESFGSAPSPAKSSEVLNVETERDCAHTCIENQNINCQAFYFCPASTKKCYLEDKHIHDINPMGLESIVAYQLITSGTRWAVSKKAENRPCNFYSRSYLAQFDQFVGKSLDNSLESSSNLEPLPDSGPDACARACIEHSCVAFDVCLDDEGQLDTSARRRQNCRLARSSIRKSDLSNNRKGCSTFVLSDMSSFRSPNATLWDLKQAADYRALGNSNDGEEIVVDAEQKEAEDGDIMNGLMEILSGSSSTTSIGNKESIVGGSHWLSRLISIMFGLFLGVVCALFWIKKEINLSEQFEWRRLKVIFGR